MDEATDIKYIHNLTEKCLTEFECVFPEDYKTFNK